MKAYARFRSVAIVGACASLTACSSISGLDGTSNYGCKAPDGVKCDSVSGTYYNALQNNLPSQRKSLPHTPSGAPHSAAPAGQDAAMGTPVAAAHVGGGNQPALLRAAPRVMRLWIKPWEDSDRDLNGESTVYVRIDDGRWLVDHIQRQAREPFAPIRPAKVTRAAQAKSETGEPARPPGAFAPGSDEGSTVNHSLKALQQRAGATTPVGEN